MKKRGSTPSKSLEQLVEAFDLMSMDDGRPLCLQQNYKQSCQQFSLRGYVTDIRNINPKACNPFGNLRNTGSIWEKLGGPVEFPWLWRYKNCVRVVSSSTFTAHRLFSKQTPLQITNSGLETKSSVEHRATGGYTNKSRVEVIILDDNDDELTTEKTHSMEELTSTVEKASVENIVTTFSLREMEKKFCLDKRKNIITDIQVEGETNDAPIEVIILNDSEDERAIILEELTGVEEKTSARKGVTTYTRQKKDNIPCLDKGKNIITEVEDNEEEFIIEPHKTRIVIGESSRAWGDDDVKDNYNTSGTIQSSKKLNRGPPYGQTVLDNLNARIATTVKTMRNQLQEKMSSTLDLSLSLYIHGTEGQKVKNEGISVESDRNRKRTFDALVNVIVPSPKSSRLMEMRKFLEKPFTSSVTTYAPQQKDKMPYLDKSKNVNTEIEDEEEFVLKPQKTRIAIGESSRAWGDIEVEDNYQNFGTFHLSKNLNKGPPYGQNVLDNLNVRIATPTNIHDQQQEKYSSTLDLSLSLYISRIEGIRKLENKGIYVESDKKRKHTVDALPNVGIPSQKSRRLMKMGKFLEKPFTSCEIIDLESASFNAGGSTRPVATVYAYQGPVLRKYGEVAGESSSRREVEQNEPDKKSGSTENSRI